MKEDDARLVQSTLVGNLDDFRKLVEKYRLAAERWAFHHVQNLSDAEDIAQEALVEAYFRLDTLLEPDKFGRWLRSIVSHIAVSWLRRRRPTVSFEEISRIDSNGYLLEQYHHYEGSRPDYLLERQEQENRLHAAIDALPPTHQRVITMFYFDDCSYKEIADHLNVSVAAVKSLLHRARQRLKEEMLRNG